MQCDVGCRLCAREHQAPLWSGAISGPNNLTASLDMAGTPRRFLPRRTAPWRISQLPGRACHFRPGRSQRGAAAPGGRALGHACRAHAATRPGGVRAASLRSVILPPRIRLAHYGHARAPPERGPRPARARRRGHTIRLRSIPQLGPRRPPVPAAKTRRSGRRAHAPPGASPQRRRI